VEAAMFAVQGNVWFGFWLPRGDFMKFVKLQAKYEVCLIHCGVGGMVDAYHWKLLRNAIWS